MKIESGKETETARYSKCRNTFLIKYFVILNNIIKILAPPRTVRLDINRDVKYRKIVGFGGAFTGAVSYLLQKLPQELQDHLYK